MIKIIKFINRLIRNKDRLKRRWRRIGHQEGFEGGRTSLKRELEDIKADSHVKLEEVGYRIREEIKSCEGDLYLPKEHVVQFYFKPAHEAYRLFRTEEARAQKI